MDHGGHVTVVPNKNRSDQRNTDKAGKVQILLPDFAKITICV